MPSTRLSTPYAAQALLALSLSVGVFAQEAIDTMTYVGCFSSSQPLDDQGSYLYQTPGWCRPICGGKNNAVFGLSEGSNCWCGDQLPAASSKVPDSNCDVVCNGYGQQNCGGDGYWSVYTVEEGTDPSSYGGSSSSGSSSSDDDSDATTAASAATPTTTAGGNTNGNQQTTAKPSVITSIAPGQTIVKTVPASEASATADTPNEASSGDGGPNVGAIAGGVVVGVVAIAAIAGGLFWFIRRKKKQAAEDEYNRTNQVNDFMRGGGERKPPQTGYSQMSDSRLDPEAGQRRDSQGSIADNQDYSRRILRVANPDGN